MVSEAAEITGVDHIGIAVPSIAEARGLYERLGLRVLHVEEVPEEHVRVAMIPCGGTRIELLEPTGPESPIARFLDRHGPGIHHICLATGDVVGVDQRLRSGGFEVLREQPGPGAEGALVQFVHPRSCSGVLLEIAQPGAAAGEEREPG